MTDPHHPQQDPDADGRREPADGSQTARHPEQEYRPGPQHPHPPEDPPTRQMPPQQTPPAPYPPPHGHDAAAGQAYSEYPPAGYRQAGYPPGYAAQQPPVGSPWAPPPGYGYGQTPGDGQAPPQGGYGAPAAAGAYQAYPPGTQQWQGQPPPGQADTAPGRPGRAGPGRGAIAGVSAAAVVAVVAVVLVLGFAWPGFFVTTVLDTQSAQSSIARVLTEDFGVTGVSTVECPSQIEVSDGATFTCQAVINGSVTSVTSTFTGDDGSYTVGPPAG